MDTNTKSPKMPALVMAAALVVAASIGSALAADPPADPQAPPSRHAEHAAEHAKMRQEWVRAKLARDANRLEITASQQAAWQGYASARSALADLRFGPPPAPDADAATIAKLRADRVADAARKLGALADATARLQAVLSPAQRTTLDQIVRDGHRHWHGRPGWHREQHDGFDGRHGGYDGGPGPGPGHAEGEDQDDSPPGA